MGAGRAGRSGRGRRRLPVLPAAVRRGNLGQRSGPLITEPAAGHGIRLGLAILDGGFFRARWDRATATERLYLQAMAVDRGADSRTPDAASRLGRPMRSLGPVRAGLISKGLIYAPEYGVVAFTVPAMADFHPTPID